MEDKRNAKSVAAEKLPVVFRHMVVAIFANQKGSEGKRFTDAVGIARWSLVNTDHMTSGAKSGWLGDMVLTSKGRKTNAEHSSESGRAMKEATFKRLYNKYRHLVEPAVTRPEEESARKRQ